VSIVLIQGTCRRPTLPLAFSCHIRRFLRRYLQLGHKAGLYTPIYDLTQAQEKTAVQDRAAQPQRAGKAGKSQRIGKGSPGKPYRYFALKELKK
jgi:hypothetical protein